MNRIVQAGGWLRACIVAAAAFSVSFVQAAEPGAGAAKISGPTTDVADPFATLRPIPTPIVTSSGGVSEPTTAVPPGVTPLTPLSGGNSPAAASPNASGPLSVIGAGKLVPLDPVADGVAPPTAKPRNAEPAMKPISPAAEPAKLGPIPRRPEPQDLTAKKSKPVVEAKPAAVKKPAAKAKPVEPPSERAAPAVNFSFPQPVIPLESSLRRWFRWSNSRR